MRLTYGEPIFAKYGFLDALNPTFTYAIPVQHGRVDGRAGWFDTDYLGIDQGPILAMVANYETGLVWKHDAPESACDPRPPCRGVQRRLAGFARGAAMRQALAGARDRARARDRRMRRRW